MLVWVLFALFICSYGQSLCYDCAFELVGAGPSGSSPMMKQWAFAYSLLKPEVSVSYTPKVAQDAYDELESLCRKTYQLDFVVTDFAHLIQDPDLDVLPMFAGSVVMAYNIPNLTTSDPQLRLSRPTLYQIFAQNITHWDDPMILDDNTKSGLNNKLKNVVGHVPIQLGLRSDNSGTTVTVMTYLDHVDERFDRPFVYRDFEFHSNYNWSFTNFIDNTTLRWGRGAFALASEILTTSGAIGYIPLSYADEAGLRFASIQNQNGTFPVPNDKAMSASVDAGSALVNGSLSDFNNTRIADPRGNASYPLTAVYFLVYHRESKSGCDAQRELFKFFNWIYTSPAAAAQIRGVPGYASFSTKFTRLVSDNLDRVQCQNRQVLANEYEESSTTPLRQAAISIAAILIFLVLLIGVMMGLKRHNRITRAAGLVFSICFLIGCEMNYISVFAWALVPSTNSICQSRVNLLCLGYTLLLGAMFAKSWEIQKIFARAQKDISPFQEQPWWQFCKVYFAGVAANVLILLVLGVSDPPYTEIQIIDELELKAIHTCSVKSARIWLAFEFVYFGCLVLWGGYLAYKTRDIWHKYNYPNESKAILMSIYNLVFCLAILFPLITVLEGNSEVVFFFTATGILFPTSFALASVYGPKILIFLSSSFKGSNKDSQGMLSTKQSKQNGTIKTAREMGHKEDSSNNRKGHHIRDERGGLIIVEEDPREREFSDDRSHPQDQRFLVPQHHQQEQEHDHAPHTQSQGLQHLPGSLDASVASTSIPGASPLSDTWRVLIPAAARHNLPSPAGGGGAETDPETEIDGVSARSGHVERSFEFDHNRS